jgi:hypothetical protein
LKTAKESERQSLALSDTDCTTTLHGTIDADSGVDAVDQQANTREESEL